MGVNKGTFHVAAKVLLRDGDKLLLLHDIFGDWDIPGGRILPIEFGGDIQDVIKRKMTEELGTDVQYQIGKPATYFQVTRVEADTGDQTQIFAVGFEVEYLGGEIKLGDHHDRYKWVDVSDLDPEHYFEYGWEKGIVKYIDQIAK